MIGVQEGLKARKQEVMRQERMRLDRVAARRAAEDGACCLHCGAGNMSLEGSFLSDGAEYQVYGCATCELSQLDRQLPAEEVLAREEENPCYQEVAANSVESEVQAHSFILDLMHRYVTGDRLLEAGCSHGYKLEAARRTGWEVEGVEMSFRSCEFVRDVLRLPVHQGTIESYLPEKPFDAIIAWHVLEHVPSVYSFLAHLRAFVAPNGYIFIQVPSYTRFRHLHPWTEHPPCFNPCHFWFFTEAALVRQVKENGFEPVYTLDDEHFMHLTVIAKAGEQPLSSQL